MMQPYNDYITPDELKAISRPRKYRNVPTEVDGYTFDSKKEAERYGELKLLERGGVICNLRLQPRYPLVVSDMLVAAYVGDFEYYIVGGPPDADPVLEDVKGVRTPLYRLKRKLVRALYGIDITEV